MGCTDPEFSLISQLIGSHLDHGRGRLLMNGWCGLAISHTMMSCRCVLSGVGGREESSGVLHGNERHTAGNTFVREICPLNFTR